ncbi:MAG: hypothetical protein PHQ43_10780 [Dehalococcoidales bacterium]|nr:hypothetical protein [Dehalococcoidales bacterium]
MTMSEQPGTFRWAVPEDLKIPHDRLRCRLDFYYHAVELTLFEGDLVERKMVDAMDVAEALASNLSFSTGLLPPDTLWWRNTRSGPMYAFYVPPQVRKLALQEKAGQPPRRLKLPLPGFIFLCTPGSPPWVYAVTKRPTKETDIVYKAPLANIFPDGRSCPGNHQYPERVADIVLSFFMSFFSGTADLVNRSKKFPKNILQLWDELDGKEDFPMDDLVKHGTIRDLLVMGVDR